MSNSDTLTLPPAPSSPGTERDIFRDEITEAISLARAETPRSSYLDTSFLINAEGFQMLGELAVPDFAATHRGWQGRIMHSRGIHHLLRVSEEVNLGDAYFEDEHREGVRQAASTLFSKMLKTNGDLEAGHDIFPNPPRPDQIKRGRELGYSDAQTTSVIAVTENPHLYGKDIASGIGIKYENHIQHLIKARKKAGDIGTFALMLKSHRDGLAIFGNNLDIEKVDTAIENRMSNAQREAIKVSAVNPDSARASLASGVGVSHKGLEKRISAVIAKWGALNMFEAISLAYWSGQINLGNFERY